MATKDVNKLLKLDVEGLASEIDEIICFLEVEELKDKLLLLKITIDCSGKNKRYVKGIIVKYYESIIDDADLNEEQKKKFLLEVLKVLIADGNTAKIKSTESEGNISVIRELGLLNKTGMLRKELKIKGQIGEAGQKDKLTYGKLKGYLLNKTNLLSKCFYTCTIYEFKLLLSQKEF